MRLVSECMMMSFRDRLALSLVIILLVICPGCGRGGGDAAHIRVAAASDLQTVLPRLIERFERMTGVTVTPSYGASGHLAEQIKGGAPFDIFLAANQSFVSDLAGQGLIEPDSVRPYARGSLVLAVYRQVGDDIGRLEDLAKPAVKKIALANPATAPYGKAAKQALERANLWKQLEPKIVLAESVRQALNYVQTGNAEAALVGRVIARVPDVLTVEIDANLYDPIIQALGILTASSRAALAESFAKLILGEEGQRILSEFGLLPVEPAASQVGAGERILLQTGERPAKEVLSQVIPAG